MPTCPASPLITRLFAAVLISFLVISADAQITGRAPGATPEKLTSISEITDVKPADVYFLELQSLIERYGIAGLTTNRKFEGAAPLRGPQLQLLVSEGRDVITFLAQGAEIPRTEIDKAFPDACSMDQNATTFTETRIAAYLECSFGAGSLSAKKPTTAITTRGRFVIFLDAALSAAQRTVNDLHMKAETASHALRMAMAKKAEEANKIIELPTDPTDFWNYVPGTWDLEMTMTGSKVTRSHLKFSKRSGNGFTLTLDSRAAKPSTSNVTVTNTPPARIGLPAKNTVRFDFRGFRFEGSPIFSGAFSGTILQKDRPVGKWAAHRRVDLDYIDLAFEASAANRNSHAIQYFTKAIELKPFASYLLSRGNVHSADGSYDKALADYSRAVSMDPQNHRALYNRAVAHRILKNYALAISDTDTLLTKHFAQLSNKERSDAYMQRGVSRLAVGLRESAINDLREALRLDPNSAGAKHTLSELGLQ